MKLLIEITEEYYKTLHNIPDTISTVDMLLIKYGKPLDNVLDEIKAEFKSKADGDDWYHTTDGLVWEEAIEIIDKHRAERGDKG